LKIKADPHAACSYTFVSVWVYSAQLLLFLVRAVSKAEFSEVYNVEGGIHAYATQVNPAVGT
jgi:hypothetical protein